MATREEQIKNIRTEAERIQSELATLKEQETLSADNLVNQPDDIELPETSEPSAPTVEPFEIPDLEDLTEKKSGVETQIQTLEDELVGASVLRARETEELDIAVAPVGVVWKEVLMDRKLSMGPTDHELPPYIF